MVDRSELFALALEGLVPLNGRIVVVGGVVIERELDVVFGRDLDLYVAGSSKNRVIEEYIDELASRGLRVFKYQSHYGLVQLHVFFENDQKSLLVDLITSSRCFCAKGFFWPNIDILTSDVEAIHSSRFDIYISPTLYVIKNFSRPLMCGDTKKSWLRLNDCLSLLGKTRLLALIKKIDSVYGCRQEIDLDSNFTLLRDERQVFSRLMAFIGYVLYSLWVNLWGFWVVVIANLRILDSASSRDLLADAKRAEHFNVEVRVWRLLRLRGIRGPQNGFFPTPVSNIPLTFLCTFPVFSKGRGLQDNMFDSAIRMYTVLDRLRIGKLYSTKTIVYSGSVSGAKEIL